MAGAGPRCSVCDHPQRSEIDKSLAVDKSSIRDIALQYGVGHMAVQRHKQSGHVSQALVTYERDRKSGSLITTAEIFHRNVERLSLAQDAVHRWLTDPDQPDRYDIGPRAGEVTVTYDDWQDLSEQGKPTKKKATLGVLLKEAERVHGITVTGFEFKHADPRKLLTDYSSELRGEVKLFVDAWNAWQQQQRDEQAAALAAANEQADLAAILTPAFFKRCLEGLLEGDLADKVAGHLSGRSVEVLTETEG